MDNSEKIKGVIIRGGKEQYAELLSNELKKMESFVFIGKRKDDNPKGLWMAISTFTTEPALAKALANFMCLRPQLAMSVIFAVHDYLQFHGIGEVILKKK